MKLTRDITPMRVKLLLVINLLIINYITAQNPSICPIGVSTEPAIKSELKSAGFVNEIYFPYFTKWNNLKNIKLSDDVRSSIVLSDINRSRKMMGNNLKFQIPAGATINGITLMIEGQSNSYKNIDEVEILLLGNDGEPKGVNKSNTSKLQKPWSSNVDGTDKTWMYGSATDTWGTSWTPEEINNENFGFQIQISNLISDSIKVEIDQISLLVHYTPAYSFCTGNCLTFYIDKYEQFGSYTWHSPLGFDIVSSSGFNQTIDLKIGNAGYGVHQICVDVYDKSGVFAEKCCRNFLYQDCTSSEIKGMAWLDLNDNKLRDSGEGIFSNLPLVLFTSSHVAVDTLLTDQFGKYHFKGLPAGAYYIKSAILADKKMVLFNSADPDTNSDITNLYGPGTTNLITTEIGKCVENIDFGYTPIVTIGDKVWLDRNYNGLQDNDESGLQNVKVRLFTSAGLLYDSLLTDTNGSYKFQNIPANKYYLIFDIPADHKPTFINQTNTAKNSKINESGRTVVYTLVNSGIINDIDAGFYQTAKIGDYVWEDKNGNGVFDTGEIPLSNITVTVTGTTGSGQPVSRQTQTNSSGLYSFSNLDPGVYTLSFANPSGYYFTLANIGTDDLDSDVIDGKISNFMVQGGELNMNLDAGLYKYGSISNFVWEDTNANGIQDSAETGIANVKVTLTEIRRDFTVVVGTKITDSYGYYIFNDLKPGNYQLSFETPAGFLSTTPNASGNDATDSDAINGLIKDIMLMSGEQNDTYDAGYFRYAAIGDLIWEDANGNGLKDDIESGLPGVSLILTGTTSTGQQVSKTELSDAAGYYRFDGLLPGVYQLNVSLINGYKFTKSDAGDDVLDSDGVNGVVSNILLSSGLDVKNIDFGLFRAGAIGDLVWEDTNGDGIQNAGEPGLSNVAVSLNGTTGGGEVLSVSVQTDAMGIYHFSDLAPGQYIVAIQTPSGYISAAADKGTNDALDSDLVNGVFPQVVLTSGQTLSNLDAGFLRYASVGDYVWIDTDGDGIQDAGEMGLPNINVSLTGTTGAGDQIQLNTTTTATGMYSFSQLLPGIYTIKVVAPSGYQFSKSDEGSDDNLDSDGLNGEILPLFIPSGFNAGNLDFGLFQRGALGDFVWEDKNGNGQQDSGEPGIAGIEVELNGLTSSGMVVSTLAVTDGTGKYVFDNLVPGTYRLIFRLPGGFDFTKTNAGVDDNVDSDVLNGQTQDIVLNSGQLLDNLDAGVYSALAIGNFVWEDTNGNGIQDQNEPGLQGVKVVLSGTNGSGELVYEENVTNANGQYGFLSVLPGIYNLSFMADASFVSTFSNRGTDETIDSDVENGVINGLVLSSGMTEIDIDAGFFRPASLGDFVWEDVNANGTQEPGEPGLEGVFVQLSGINGINENVNLATTTDINGRFNFEFLKPGNYQLSFEVPNAFLWTKSLVGSDANIDSDADSGLINNILVVSGSNQNNLDGGVYRLGSIGDYVWEDSNANGIQDLTESGLSGVQLGLNGTDGCGLAVSKIATTNSNGYYLFTDLVPGNYNLTVLKPDHFRFTLSDQGSDDDKDSDSENGVLTGIEILSGQMKASFDFGLLNGISLGDFVWDDLNTNGIQDTGEPGIEGVMINISGTSFDGNGISMTTTTNGSGNYTFSGIYPGNYMITVSLPDHFSPTKAMAGFDQNKDSNLSENLTSFSFTVNGDTDDFSIDFGLVKLGSIGDLVWEDMNCNGVRESGEPGLPSVKVKLEGVDLFSAIILDSTVTDANGMYKFDNLKPGFYTLQFETLGAYEFSAAMINIVELKSGDQILNIDAPFFRKASIGDFVWNDINENGVQDVGEPGLAGVNVTLTSTAFSEVIIHTAVSDATGRYIITGIKPGAYDIAFSIPAGYQPTSPMAGTEINIDSNIDNNGNAGNIQISSGDQRTDVDAGYITTSKAFIGDLVWEDNNGNGIREDGEPGIGGVSVLLEGVTTDGLTINLSTTTDASGVYSFSGLAAGSYQVTFVKIPEYEYTLSNTGNEDVDSDADATNGTTGFLVLSTGEVKTDVDAGYVRLSSIGDFVWNDINENGVQDVGEPGLAGVNVTLTSTAFSEVIIHTAVSDATGRYIITGIKPGAYDIAFSIPAGYQPTSPMAGTEINIDSNIDNNGNAGNIQISSGDQRTDVDAGYITTSKAFIGDLVWEDNNGNGIREDGEPGIGGVSVLLEGVTTDGLTINLSTTTDASGVYGFSGLAAGSYQVTFVKIPEYEYTLSNTGNEDVDSDADATNGTTGFLVLSTGEVKTGVDAGYVRLTSIGDFVWNDINENGVQDVGEPGLAGVNVTLTSTAFSEVIIHTAVSDATGRYIITGIKPGAYDIAFSIPAGYQPTSPMAGTEINIDSNIDNNGNAGNIQISSGDQRTDVDAGYITTSKAFIGDLVWEDNNGNGIREDGEPGIEGVSVLLEGVTTDGLTINLSTTTDASGLYGFSGLAAGSYQVTFVKSPEYEYTLSNTGNEDVDSDADATNGTTGFLMLSTGEVKTDVDAGYVRLSSIGDFVWNDINENGLYESNEPGIGGVLLKLKDLQGNEIASASSAEIGYYFFSNIWPGQYIVEASFPSGFALTDQNNTDQQLNSDFTLINGVASTGLINILSNTVIFDIDLGLKASVAGISGFVWSDDNGNGVKEGTEATKDSILVYLLDMSGDTLKVDTTDLFGRYEFVDLLSGQYTVSFEILQDSLFTYYQRGSDKLNDSDVFIQNTGKTSPINIQAGNDVTGVNAGYVGYSEIGDFVWLDENEDGLQSAGESGINGITIYLRNQAGVVIDSTVSALKPGTSLSGYYHFTVPYGDYSLRFVLRDNFKFSNIIASVPDLNSDVSNLTLGTTDNFAVLPNQVKMDIDAGYILLAPVTGNIKGVVWEDGNNNKIRDTGEDVLGGVTVSLYNLGGTLVSSQISAPDGTYMFVDIPFGDYYTKVPVVSDKVFVLFSGVSISGDSDVSNDFGVGTSRLLTLFPGETLSDIDMGYAKKISIGNFVWDDTNNNGLQDAGELGISNVKVSLINQMGAIEKMTLSNSNGSYTFNDVAVGKYRISFEILAGYVFAINNNTDQTKNSKPDLNTGITNLLDFSVQQDYINIDAGYVKAASIGDNVWLDLNGNGFFQTGEPGIANVKVLLYTSTGILTDSTVTSFQPGGTFSGYYRFSNVRPGSYYIKFLLPASYLISPPLIGDENRDNNITGSNGPLTTDAFSVDINQAVDNIDAAAYIPATLGDKVWNDINMNGAQDPGEPGVAGITVTLFSQSGQPLDTKITDADGLYAFGGLKQRLYYLQFSIPDGFEFTGQNVSGNSATDSDVDATGTTPLISLAHGSTFLDVDAGIHSTNANLIMGNIWNDLNKDGIRTFDEPLKPNIKVYLKNNIQEVIATTTTNHAGMYCFASETTGQHLVLIEPPVDYVFTNKNVGGNPSMDSDVNEQGVSDMVMLNDTYVMKYIDAGFYYKVSASVNGVVWKDLNNNGIQDGNDELMPNVVIFLFNKFKTFIKSTKTDENGAYTLRNLDAGQYYCKVPEFPDLAYVMFTGANQDKDSDITNQYGLGTSRLITLVAGVPFTHFDFGYTDTTLKIVPDKTESMQLEIYPNPAFNDIKLRLPGKTDKGQFYIVNNMGAVLRNGNVESHDSQLNISDLPPGKYSLHIITSENKWVKSFVKLSNW